MTPQEAADAIDAVWRIESARLVAGLARIVGDVGLAEDLAQDALVAALEQWPASGVPDNPGAWLMATAKHRAIDQLRRRKMQDTKHEYIGRELSERQVSPEEDLAAALDDQVGDDLLSLIFTACHPVLTTEARVALTLRLLGGLTTEEIARAFLVPKATIQQRIVRAKRTLAAARVPFELPRVALMEIQASRIRARVGPGGEPILLLDQDRGKWDHLLISRGLAALERAERSGGGGTYGPYALQAAIAACHARAHRGRDGLDADRGAVRRPRSARAIPGGGAEPRGRARDGVRPGGGPRARRCADRGPGLGGLSSAAERARGSARQARPFRGG